MDLQNPKDPSVLKIVRKANSLRRDKNATAITKRYGWFSEVLLFLGKKRQENGTGTKILRRQQKTTDSSAVLFLVRKGPLGMVCES